MTEDSRQAALPGFGATVWLLLRTARRRAEGRKRRQREILQTRNRKQASSTDWSGIGAVLTFVLMLVLHGCAAALFYGAITAGQRLDAQQGGKIVVSPSFLERFEQAQSDSELSGAALSEALHISTEYGGSVPSIQKTLARQCAERGSGGFVSQSAAVSGMQGLPRSGPTAGLLATLVLLWWSVMLVFQGEGLELDLQRRRHPMWEWLLSHPVSPGAVFLAEMLAPIAANPVYLTAPLFVGALYGLAYNVGVGFLAALVIGIPVSVAAACLGKALEIGVILRFPPRTRGAVIGLMSWMGYASMMLLLLCMASFSKIATWVGEFLRPLTFIQWPWAGWLLGAWRGGFAFPAGLLTGWGVSGVILAAAIGFSLWGTRRGIGGDFGRADTAPTRTGSLRFGKDPLYHKELLWFARDRSAIVQTILIPLTVAGVQLFNMRGLVSHAQGAWNSLCGTSFLFGTYFLWILGPKSLASEGNALWIAFTWPTGLESLLKAKARLWSLIASGIVGLVLLYAVYIFPSDAWKVALAGVGWLFFGRSMAEKTVTLVRVASSSGEPEKISRTQQWAASLGMLTFAIGIFTGQWNLAVVGIVYSWLTAAAMWQNFRARLPYLYDPWSETLPPAPTLMHAMIAISILVECAAVVTGIAVGFGGRSHLAVVQVLAYAICAALVALGTSGFLQRREVEWRKVWLWNDPAETYPGALGSSLRRSRFTPWLVATLGGVALGTFGLGYIALLVRFPATAEWIRHAQEQMASRPELLSAYRIIAITMAPFAEEYLFRGLLFRALDREWGGWRAILGSAAFFAIYHPALSWLPVGCLGVANALLFKRSGRLAPCVLLHMVYNATVLLR